MKQEGRQSRKWKIAFGCVALLLGLWMLLALVLPLWLRGALEDRLSGSLRAPVSVRAVRLNPFTLQLKVEHVRVANPDGEGALLTFEELTLSPAPGTVRGAPAVLLSVGVSKPVLDIAYLGQGKFSFSELGGTEPESGAEDASFPWPSFVVPDRLELVDGTVLLRDEPLGLSHAVRKIRFSASFLPPESGRAEAPPFLSAEYNGVRFEVTGRQFPRGSTLRTEFTLHTAPLELGHFRRYLEAYTPLRLEKGSVQLDLTLGLSAGEGGAVEADFFGGALVENAVVLAPDGGVAGRLGKGDFRLRHFTLSERRVNLSRVELSGLYLRAGRDKDGRIDWEKWLGAMFSASDSGESVPVSEEPERVPLIVEGADLILRDSDFTWTDAAWADTGKIEITGVDGRIAEYSTRPEARTTLRLSFGISREGVLALEGVGYFDPASLDVDLTVEDLPIMLARPFLGDTPLRDAAGRVDFKGRLGVAKEQVSLQRASLALRSLSFGRGKTGKEAVQVRAVNVADLAFDLRGKRLTAARVDLRTPSVRLRSGQQGILPDLPEQTSGRAAAATAGHAPGAWTVEAGKLSVSGGRVEMASQGTGRNADRVLLADWGGEAGPVSLDPRKTVRFTLHTRGEKGGALRLEGSVRPEPFELKTDVKTEDLRLESLEMFLRPWTALAVTGRAAADLSLALRRGDAQSPWEGAVSGSATLRDVSLADAVSGARLGRFRRFTVDRARYDSAAGTFSAGELLLDLPRLSLRLEKDGNFNLGRALFPQTSGTGAGSAPSAGAASVSSSPGGTRPFLAPFSSLSVGAIRIQNGSLLFRDERLSPPLTLSAVDLKASCTAFSSSPSSRARLSLSAQLDGAPLRVSGQINPALFPPVLDLDISAAGLDLRPYSPYAVKYLGYPVEQGRLSLETKLTTSGRDFRTENRLRLEKLALGSRDTRPGAPDYPVTLGISLMQGLNGDIELNLPVWGRLDASDIRMGSLAGKVAGGVLTKILTSPFALLGGLVSLGSGGNDGLRMTAFAPGRDTLSRQAREQAAAIARLLEQRPRMTVELAGMYEPASDAEALAASLVRKRILESGTGPEFSARRGNAAGSGTGMPRAEYENRLFELYRLQRAKEGTAPVLREEPDVMERWLAERERVETADLKMLAGQRAEAVRRAILEAGPGLAPRVRLALDAYGRPDVRAGAGRVEVRLR